MASDELIFLLDFPKAPELLKYVVTICRTTIDECHAKGEVPPDKFGLGTECAAAMLTLQSITPARLKAMLDVIGGYYAATKLYDSKYEKDPEALKDAEELMLFAAGLERKAREAGWRLQ